MADDSKQIDELGKRIDELGKRVDDNTREINKHFEEIYSRIGDVVRNIAKSAEDTSKAAEKQLMRIEQLEDFGQDIGKQTEELKALETATGRNLGQISKRMETLEKQGAGDLDGKAIEKSISLILKRLTDLEAAVKKMGK
ncbi:MAG: hypothetical protein IPP87_21670 [Ideonella sp.]|jgi:methyl-accepting chemotaxis protein|nr:hypothetical protein [Ideonella sp.]MBL0151126.1 hypothetical protein [Ideonella sp.]